MNNTEPDAEGIVDSAVLFTMGILFGGLALDMGGPQPQDRTLRQSLIDLLLNSIKEGSFGPLRLVRRDDGLYLTGCGLMHPVDSPEHAEAVVAQLIEGLKPMLQGLGADAVLRLEPVDDINVTDESCPQGMAGTIDGYDAADDSGDVTWHDCTETIEPTCDLCPASTAATVAGSEHAAAPAAHERLAETEQSSVALVTDAPAIAPAAEAPPIGPVAGAPIIAPAVEAPAKAPPASPCLITLKPLKQPGRQSAFEHIDRTLDEIVSRMHSCKSVA